MDNNIDRQQHYLDKLHSDILSIMDEVDRICQVYQLHYYLMCGSCLGALRHKGFIPWDDDLDIAMPRADFDKFIELIEKQSEKKPVLNNQFYLRWISTEQYYNQDFAKVCIKGTVFKADDGKADQNAGIFIDVFPLESCSHFSERIARVSRIYKHLHSCLYLKGAKKGAMDWRLRHWLRNLIVKVIPNRYIYKFMLWIIRPKDVNNIEYQALFATPYPIQRQVFPKSWHGDGHRMQFENRFYLCPSEPDKVMRLIYGDNYMDLPPINKRKTHCPVRVVFSDGEEMVFDNNNTFISYDDLLD